MVEKNIGFKTVGESKDWFANVIHVCDGATAHKDFIEIFTKYATKLKQVRGEGKSICYAESKRDTGVYLIGKYIIDATYKAQEFKTARDYRDALEQVGGYKIYYAEVNGVTGVIKANLWLDPAEYKRRQIRLTVELEGGKHMTSLLRVYELTYLIYCLREGKTDAKFWEWVNCATKVIQINHISGNFTDSCRPELLEICNIHENLAHAAILRKYRQWNNENEGLTLLVASVKDCLGIIQNYKDAGEKVDYDAVYRQLYDEGLVLI